MRNKLMLLIFLLAASGCSKREYVIGIGEKLHHGKFDYSVNDLIITRFIKHDRDTLNAKGMFYIVKFKVDNNSLKRQHKWDNSIVYITDERAGEFIPEPDVREFFYRSHNLLPANEFNTPAGSSDSSWIAFDLPFNVTMPYLKARGKMLPGDIFNGALFRRVRIKLY